MRPFAGMSGAGGFLGDNGPALQAVLNEPWGVDLDAAGNVFIADAGNSRIRMVATNGVIGTVVGGGTGAVSTKATESTLGSATAIALDASGDLFIADTFNNRIQLVTHDGTITTIAGTGSIGWSGDGGPAKNASLHLPIGIAVGPRAEVYVADYANHRVRRLVPSSTADAR